MGSSRNWIGPIFWVVLAVGAIVLIARPQNGDKRGVERGVASSQLEPTNITEVPKVMEGAEQAANLTGIYPFAGLAYYNLIMTKWMSCVMAQGSNDTAASEHAPSSGEKERKLYDSYVAEFAAKQGAQCAAYTDIEAGVRQFAEELADGQAAQDKYYEFIILNPGDEAGTWTEENIGIFRTADECTRAERAVHRINIPTRQCRAAPFHPSRRSSKPGPAVPIR